MEKQFALGSRRLGVNWLAQFDRPVFDVWKRGVVSDTDRPSRLGHCGHQRSALEEDTETDSTGRWSRRLPDTEAVVVIARSTQEAIVVNVPSL